LGSIAVLGVLLALAFAQGGCTHELEMRGCRELFVEFPVDPVAAQANVPASYRVKVQEDGWAVLLLMVQDCDQGNLDHVLRVKPLRFSHVWIEVVGPEETGAVLTGTLRSLPTAYYYATPHQTESALGHVALTLVGIASERVDEIALGGVPGDARKGQVTENRASVGYRWTDTSRPLAAPQYVTGRRRFDREFGRLWKRRSTGTVECRSNFLGASDVVLQADPDSAVGRLHLGSILRGAGHVVEMTDCLAIIEVGSR
jgi:hypothetical protein